MFEQGGSVGTRVQALWATAQAIVRQSASACVLFVVGMAVLGSAADIAGIAEETGVTMGINVAGLFAGFMLTRTMLDQSGLTTGGLGRGFGAYFGLSILTGLGTVIGLVLLIVPGILLMIRWLPAFGFLMGDGDDVSLALSSSWQRTRGHFWALFVGALPLVALMLVTATSYGLADTEEMGPSSLWYVVANLALYGLSLCWNAYGIAAFALLKDNRDQLSGVFG